LMRHSERMRADSLVAEAVVVGGVFGGIVGYSS
jgi:hypothetical protein